MFYIRLAEHNFCIHNKFDYIEKLCTNYTVDECEAAEIAVSAEEAEKEAHCESFPEGYLESLAIYRKICEMLIDDGIMLFHCSALAVDGEGVLFTAPSGTGKSTHARLWRGIFGKRAVVVNDDKPLIRITENRVVVNGTPFCGKHGLENNISAQVKYIFVLSQSEKNSVRRLSAAEALPALLKQTYLPRENAEKMKKTIEMAKKLTACTEIFALCCNISDEAVLTAYNAMKGDKYEAEGRNCH